MILQMVSSIYNTSLELNFCMLQREENSVQQLKIKELQLELASVRADVNLVESQMSSALTSKNAEIEALTNLSESYRKQVVSAEGKLASLQVLDRANLHMQFTLVQEVLPLMNSPSLISFGCVWV